jgi:YVTN family beta-propeller protein
VEVGKFPHEAALSADGRRLYVSDNGVLWMTEDSPGANTIPVLDVPGMKKLYSIDLGRFHRPHGIALVGDRLLATTERPFGLIMIDPVRRTVVRDFDVRGKSPHMVMPTPDGRRALVSDSDSDCVAAIDLNTGETKNIATGAHPQGGVFSPDGKRLYITATNANRIDIIDPVRLVVTGSIPTGKGPARIAITPDGKTLIYNLQFEPAVGFADVAGGKQVTTVPVAARPLSLTITPDGARAFAGIQELDQLVFISVRDRRIERVLELPKGSGPDPAIPIGVSR